MASSSGTCEGGLAGVSLRQGPGSCEDFSPQLGGLWQATGQGRMGAVAAMSVRTSPAYQAVEGQRDPVLEAVKQRADIWPGSGCLAQTLLQ